MLREKKLVRIKSAKTGGLRIAPPPKSSLSCGQGNLETQRKPPEIRGLNRSAKPELYTGLVELEGALTLNEIYLGQ
jgi:hypothetical protein